MGGRLVPTLYKKWFFLKFRFSVNVKKDSECPIAGIGWAVAKRDD